MRRTWPLWAGAAWLAAAGPAAARPADGAQRLGDQPAAVDVDFQLATAVAVGPDGLATALVRQGDRAVVRRARTGRPFGRSRRLPLGDDPASPTVTAGTGFAALAWTRFDATYLPRPYDREEPCCRRVRAALLDRSGHVTHPRTLSSPNANVLGAIGAVRGRRVVLAWTDARGVRTSIGVRGRGFRRPVTVTSSTRSTLLAVALPRATPHVFLLVGSRRPRIEEAWRSGGRTRRVELGAFDVSPFGVRAASTPAGHLLVTADVFRRPRLRRLVVFSRRPGHRLRVTRVRLRSISPTATAAALAPSGRGMVATADGRGGLILRSVDSTGHLGRATSVRTGGAPIDSAVAIASSGAGALAVHVFHGTSRRRRDTLVAWPLHAGGRPGSRHTVSPAGSSVSGALAATADGRVAWYQGRSTYAAMVR
jgi:hypothetical protein